MDATLKTIACQQLSLFVEVCDHTLGLRRKRDRFKALAKKLFLSDDGVQALLERMKRMIENERGVVAAQTFLGVNRMERDMGEVRNVLDLQMEDRAEQKVEKIGQRWRGSLLRALSWDETAMRDGPSGREPDRVWVTRWRRHTEQAVSQTGDWIEKDDKFMAWVNGTDATKSPAILGLEGGGGSGKTKLAASVVTRLLSRRRVDDQQKTRSSVAYYFVETDSKTASAQATTGTASEDRVVATVSRSLLWQLAADDEVFLKSAVAVSEKARVFKGHLDMWTQLLLKNKERAAMSSTFFVVVDGLTDEADIQDLVPVLQALTDNPDSRLRLLLTGRPRTFELLRKASGIAFDTIELGEANVQDIELYIEHRMDSIYYLQDRERSGVSEMRNKILERLKTATEGDYRKIAAVLDNITKSDDPDEIDSFLEDAATLAAQQIEVEIERLNKTSTPKVISDINEMIMWVLWGKWWFKPHTMEGALALKPGNGPTIAGVGNTVGNGNGPPQKTLSSLEDKIRHGKYPIFKLDSGVVLFTAGLNDAMIRIPKKRRSDDDAAGAGSSVSKEIHPSEVDMVKHYLKTVCPPEIYAKFGFDDFFEEKRVRKSNYIYQDPDNAHLVLAMRCIRGLVDQRDEKMERMHTYCREYLMDHLWDGENEMMVDDNTVRSGRLGLTDRELRSHAGEMLVRLFTEDYGIQSLFSLICAREEQRESSLMRRIMPEVWEPWVFNKKAEEVLTSYFNDRAVLENIRDTDLVKEFNRSDTDKYSAILMPATKLAAGRLLSEDATAWEIETAFHFLLIVRAKVRRYHLLRVMGRYSLVADTMLS
jgi:hypothetical protein